MPMRKLLPVLLMLLCTPLPELCAQSIFKAAAVEVSGDKVRKGRRTFYVHVVKEHQTLYSIARAYGVTTRDIIDSNKNLNLDAVPIHPGDMLYIPVIAEAAAAKVEEETVPVTPDPEITPALEREDLIPVQADTTLLIIEDEPIQTVEATEELSGEDPFFYDIPEVIHVTLLLPLGTATKPNEHYFNFYAGALMAARQAGRSGINLDIEALDLSEAGQEEIRARLEKSDIILGPVSSADISSVLPLLPEDKYVISPMDTKTAPLTRDAHVILAATPVSAQIEDAVSWMTADTDSTDVIIIPREEGRALNANTRAMVGEIQRDTTGLHIEEVSYLISKGLEMDEWFDANVHFADTTCRIFPVSDNEAFIKEVIRAANVQSFKGKDVYLYGPAKVRAAEMEDLCNARLHVSASYHINYKEAAVQQFVLDWRAVMKGEPDSFAFHGYDTMLYFTGICAEYGRQWPEKLPEYTRDGLQTRFKFSHTDAKGYVNEGIRRVVYSNNFKAEILR